MCLCFWGMHTICQYDSKSTAIAREDYSPGLGRPRESARETPCRQNLRMRIGPLSETGRRGGDVKWQGFRLRQGCPYFGNPTKPQLLLQGALKASRSATVKAGILAVSNAVFRAWCMSLPFQIRRCLRKTRIIALRGSQELLLSCPQD